MKLDLLIAFLLSLTIILFSSFRDDSFNTDVPGCNDINACNYNPAATSNDGSCLYSGQACPNVDACTINSVVDENCNCVGTPRICDDLNPCTEDSCNPAFGCFSVPITIDADGDGICDAGDTCPNLFGQIGSPCDDGNPCTDNDVIDANCN